MPNERRRGDPRDECQIEAAVILPDRPGSVPCMVTDLSVSGARLHIEPPLDLTKTFTLALPLLPERDDARTVELRWLENGAAGVRFVGGPKR